MDASACERRACSEWDYQVGRELEDRNVPVVLTGVIANWPAIMRWDPGSGGLQHLKSLAGALPVQAITSSTGSAFYGHIKGHERVSVSFGDFIDQTMTRAPETKDCGSASPQLSVEGDAGFQDPCKYASHSTQIGVKESSGPEREQSLKKSTFDVQLYLAQVPIYSKDGSGETALSPLMEDIAMPTTVKVERVSDINLWMSMNNSRSSTHYDPFHNLLCVVAGEKKVTLWPPSAAAFLYPLPIHGEASNHSGVDFVQPDYQSYPRFKNAKSVAQIATVYPGDALFIPEGWYHQVDNSGVTIAVNFWWPSKMSLALGTDMDAYFLRRIIVSLIDKEKKRILEEKPEDATQWRKAHSPVHANVVDTCELVHGLEHCIKGSDVGEDVHLKEETSAMLLPVAHVNEAGSGASRLELQNTSRQHSQNWIHQGFDVGCSPTQVSSLLNSAGFEHGYAYSQDEDYPPELIFEEDVNYIGEKTQNKTNGLDSGQQQKLKLEDLTAFETYHLKCLMASMSKEDASLQDAASNSRSSTRQLDQEECATSNHLQLSFTDEDDHLKGASNDGISVQIEDDPVTRVFSVLKAVSIKRILLVMVGQFPRTLQTLIMTKLSPSAAEMLTRKFEESDSSTDPLLLDFYEQFYSAFESPEAVMEILVNLKEEFAAQALHNVMAQFLGLSCCPNL